MKSLSCDYLIIGTGAAGLTAALELADHGSVLLTCKSKRSESNSTYAQGGISCVISEEDSFERHIEDTLQTGNGISDPQSVREIIEAGPESVRALERHGVKFTERSSGNYDLGKEGGHSKRRVLHAGDITGKAITRALIERVQEHPNVTLIENWIAIDLVPSDWIQADGPNRNLGCYFLDQAHHEIIAVRSATTILATGGLGKVYPYTSNPDIATGDGVAMAWRAGIPLRDMEFVQFHPTCLYHPLAKSFLISEAVRGEGAVLKDIRGHAFMEDLPMKSLSPRDVTARAIDSVMKKNGDPYVVLDITHQSEEFIKNRFPTLFKTCLKYGINMAEDPIPVVPAAHYSCGGVLATTSGVTALPGLYAIGEVASTGLHGANRLASNSLLETVVCATKATQHILSNPAQPNPEVEIPPWKSGNAVASEEAVVVEHDWNEVRSVMWDYVGIVRSDRRLARAEKRIRALREEIKNYYNAYLITPDLLELRNVADTASLIIRSAQQRKESRGLHFTRDYPEATETPQSHIIQDDPGATN